jgi:F-type H+-transporting ATPase subunit b
MQPSEIISVNLWQILISLANLLILFLLFKKFLFAPVKAFVAKRQAAVDEQYEKAAAARAAAEADKAAWEETMSSAKEQADALVKQGAETAARRRDAILADAKAQAEGIVKAAQTEAALEKEKAADEVKQEIVDVSVLLTEKLLGREIKADDHDALFNAFLNDMGDGDDIRS